MLAMAWQSFIQAASSADVLPWEQISYIAPDAATRAYPVLCSETLVLYSYDCHPAETSAYYAHISLPIIIDLTSNCIAQLGKGFMAMLKDLKAEGESKTHI